MTREGTAGDRDPGGGDAGDGDDRRRADRLDAWWARQGPDPAGRVVGWRRPATGRAGDIAVVSVVRHPPPAGLRCDRYVVRMPPAVPVMPTDDLPAHAAVLRALDSGPVPVPAVVAVEDDRRWLGAPFLVLGFADGRPGPEVPALDRQLLQAPPATQRRMQRAFVDVLAAVHRTNWRRAGLGAVLRGGRGTLAAELGWWRRYLAWATDGAPPPDLAAALAWCERTRPRAEPPPSLCWGDARLGNVLFADDGTVRAVLDWDLASIGPGEMDLAWFLVLDDLVTRLTGRRVPGFAPRGAVVRRYERAVGRPVVDLAWHEVFALVRSAAISERLARIADAGGNPYPGPRGNANPTVVEAVRRITGPV